MTNDIKYPVQYANKKEGNPIMDKNDKLDVYYPGIYIYFSFRTALIIIEYD